MCVFSKLSNLKLNDASLFIISVSRFINISYLQNDRISSLKLASLRITVSVTFYLLRYCKNITYIYDSSTPLLTTNNILTCMRLVKYKKCVQRVLNTLIIKNVCFQIYTCFDYWLLLTRYAFLF